MSNTDKPTPLESAVKLVLIALGVVVFAYLLSLLPPLERPLPGTPISFEDAMFGAVGALLLALFVAVGDQLKRFVDERLPGNNQVPPETGRVLSYLVVFLAFVAVYQLLARAVVPFLAASRTAWLFDLVYVLIALGLLIAVALPLYRSVDGLVELVTNRLSREPLGRDGSDGIDLAEDDAGDEPTN